MTAKVNSVWAIDIGNTSLKAMRLRSAGDEIEIIGIDSIELSKPLTTAGMTEEERQEIISECIRAFIDKNNVTKTDDIAISVPGQSSFARFITLPPVDPKGIPKIVQYEAIQQIPFDINEVEWDWQIMEKPDSPETEVGIFAIKNELINAALEPFQRENLKITTVQMSPMALYNYACYEFKELDEQGKNAVIVISMGSENTELVICSKTKVWQRSISIGGNNFTNAIAEAFKLNVEKAEKLKRNAPMSKYAKQIFHAMRPVFTDMGGEIQRSIGYFSSSNRGVKFVKVIALGGAMKLQGVTKYLQQTLQIPVVRPETYQEVKISDAVSPTKVHENIGELGTNYGLALQGLGVAKIQSNLLPRRIARAMAWARKSQMMTIAASVLLIVSLMSFAKTALDNKSYNSEEKTRRQIEMVINKAKNASNKLKKEEGKQSTYDKIIAKQFDIFKYRDVIPSLKQQILKCLPDESNNSSQASLYKDFREKNAEAIKSVPRQKRKLVFVTSMKISYAEDVKTAQFGQGATRRRTTSTKSSGDDMMGGMGMMGPGMGMFGREFAPPSRSRKPSRKSKRGADKEETDEQKSGAGFVVEIEGFTPYSDIDALFDPIGVGSNKNKWGVITWLKHFDDVVDGNSTFEIFDTSSTNNFILTTGEVDLEDGEMPIGIGIEKTVQRSPEAKDSSRDRGRTRRSGRAGSGSDVVDEEVVLIDQMTGEEISKTFVLDENYRKVYDTYDNPQYSVNDHWFSIKAKFLWKKADSDKDSNTDSSSKKSRRSQRGR